LFGTNLFEAEPFRRKFNAVLHGFHAKTKALALPVCRHANPWILAVTICLAACTDVRIERHGAPQQRVMSRIYSVGLPAFRERILRGFMKISNSTVVPFLHMNVIELKPPNYPQDWATTWVDPGNFLEAYRSISGAGRVQDLLIEEPTGDRYWPSEYETAAGAVKFRCGFILHFEQKGPLLTEVQVYEKVPEVWAGEHWAFLLHGIGVGKVHDIRFVEPTVKDRLEVLDALNEIASGH
jgi:hypothetical protein